MLAPGGPEIMRPDQRAIRLAHFAETLLTAISKRSVQFLRMNGAGTISKCQTSYFLHRTI